MRKDNEKKDKALQDHYEKRYAEIAKSLAEADKQKEKKNLKGSKSLPSKASSSTELDLSSNVLPQKRRRGIDHQADQEATTFVKTLKSKRSAKPSYEEVLRMLE